MLVSALITLTVPLPEFTTYTSFRRGLTASPEGPAPTAITRSWRMLTRSSTVTVLLPPLLM